MPFHDLHIACPGNDAEIQTTLDFLAELDYSVVAFTVSITSKLPAQLPGVHIERFRIPPTLKVLTRLTLTISDNAQNHRINTLTSTYDLVALRPTNDKAFQLCCSSLECDIISLDFTQRVPFPIKFKTVASALQRGVRFEICYSPGITGGNDARRNLIGGAAALIRATRGRGIILASEAKSALGLRGPWDVINLAQVWGLSQERGKEAICEEAGRVVRLAGIKRTSFRGVVDIINDGSREMMLETAPSTEEGGHVSELATDVRKTKAPTPPRALPQVTVIPEKKTSNDKAKRKASQASLNDQSQDSKTESKPMSRREQKRQAKKARLERAAGIIKEAPKATVEESSGSKPKSNGFPIQHEALAMEKTD